MIKKLRQIIYNLLKKSEKFFQTDMIYLAKGGFWLTLGQIASSLSSFLLAIAFANLLPKETYGTYKYVLSLIGLLSVFTLSGMNTALTRSVARGFEGSLIPILKEKIKWGAVGSIISLTIAIYYYLNGNLTLTICFIITTTFLPFMDSLGIYGSFLNGRKNFKLNTKYNIITKTISTILIMLILVFSKNIFLILFVYFISYTSLKFIFLKLSIKKEKPNSKIELDTISYGRHLSLMNIIGIIASQIDKILVWHFIGPAQLAIYSISVALPEQIKGFLKNISTLAFPKFSQKTILEIRKTIYQKIYRLFILLIFIVIAYCLLTPLIFKLFFPKYSESIFYSQIFSISILSLVNILLDVLFKTAGNKKYLYKTNIFGATIKTLSILIGVIYYGILGLIIARLVSQIISIIFNISESKKLFKFIENSNNKEYNI